MSNVEAVIFGKRACFTMIQANVERMTYPFITPSSARAILEAILRKPEFRYEIKEIEVLNPIDYFSVKVNEVKGRMHSKERIFVNSTNQDKGRTQRNMTGLVDVAYLLKAEIILTEKGKKEKDSHGGENTPEKYMCIFNKRVEKGQSFHTPYFGFREFTAFFRPKTQEDKPISANLIVPNMLYDVYDIWDLSKSVNDLKVSFFSAAMKSGVIKVPSWNEIKKF